MSKDFMAHFLQACCESSSAAVVRERSQNTRYQEVSSEYRGILKEIEQTLGKNRSLLRRLEEAESERASMDDDWLYRQAFRDCLTLLRWMGAFSSDG